MVTPRRPYEVQYDENGQLIVPAAQPGAGPDPTAAPEPFAGGGAFTENVEPELAPQGQVPSAMSQVQAIQALGRNNPVVGETPAPAAATPDQPEVTFGVGRAAPRPAPQPAAPAAGQPGGAPQPAAPAAGQPGAVPQQAAPAKPLSDVEIADQVINAGADPIQLYRQGQINARQLRELEGQGMGRNAAMRARSKYESLAGDIRAQRSLEKSIRDKAEQEARDREIEVQHTFNLEVAKAKAKNSVEDKKKVDDFEDQLGKLQEARDNDVISDEVFRREQQGLYARYWGGDQADFPQEQGLGQFTEENYRIAPNGDEYMRDPVSGSWSRTRTAEQIEQDRGKPEAELNKERADRMRALREDVKDFRERFLVQNGRYPTNDEIKTEMQGQAEMFSGLLGEESQAPAGAEGAAPPAGRAAAIQGETKAAAEAQFQKPLTRGNLASQDLTGRTEYVMSKLDERLKAQGLTRENMPEGVKQTVGLYNGAMSTINRLKSGGELKQLDQSEQIQLNALMSSTRFYEEMLLGQ